MILEGSKYIVAKILNHDAKKCWQNLLKAWFRCSMPSAQKPLLAGIRNLEEWIWNGEYLFLPKFWTSMWRNPDKTFSKRRFSALSLQHRNHFSPELISWKYEFGVVNSYCCQNFEERFEEKLTKPSQSVLRVLCAFGTETTFRWNFKVSKDELEVPHYLKWR